MSKTDLCKEKDMKGSSVEEASTTVTIEITELEGTVETGVALTEAKTPYEVLLKTALETTSCDLACLTVKHGDVCIKDALDTMTSGSAQAPLKATIASLVAKLAHPEWDTRNHQAQIGGKYSLRSIDTSHVSSFLFENGFYNTATTFALTRSFEKAEPYNKSYTGKITPKPCKDAFLNVVEFINTSSSATPEFLKLMLAYTMLFLKERKAKHTTLKESAIILSKEVNVRSVSDALDKINKLTGHGLSVIPVIAVHTLITIIQPHIWPSITDIKPLKEHTASDSHTGSYGDIEGFGASKPMLAIEIKHKLAVSDTVIATFDKKTAGTDIRLKFILTTAKTPTCYAQNNICVQTVTTFITAYLHQTLLYDASICTVFINALRKHVAGYPNLSISNKQAVNEILTTLLV